MCYCTCAQQISVVTPWINKIPMPSNSTLCIVSVAVHSSVYLFTQLWKPDFKRFLKG